MIGTDRSLPLTRRQFAHGLLWLPLLARGTRLGAEPASLTRGVFPTGELRTRIRLTAERLAKAAPSPEDLDLGGRYLGALALLPPAGLDLARLAKDLLAQQRADGRFGDHELRLDAAGEEAAQASLLWANGRLLVGLLEYWEGTGDAAVLAACRRLGAFLVSARETCGAPKAAERLATRDGLTCLTQLAEGFVLLGEATEDRRFLEEARSVLPFLGSPQASPAAGYLTTLRGLLRLARATDDRALLRDLAARFHDFVGSADDAAGQAEFLRLALALWPATGDPFFLEHAERSLVNHFRFAQGAGGDFESRRREALGFEAPPGTTGPVSGATIEAYRAWRDVLDGLVRTEGDTTFVDLFDDAEVTLPGMAFSLRHESEQPGESRLTLDVLDATAGWQGLALRRPPWASRTDVRFGGARVSPAPSPYARFVRRWRAGEQLEMTLGLEARLETRDHRSHSRTELPGATEAQLFLGPRLMAAHEGPNAAFLARSGTASPTLLLPGVFPLARESESAGSFSKAAENVSLRYREEGEGSATGTVTLQPLAAATGLPPGRTAVWLRYQKVD